MRVYNRSMSKSIKESIKDGNMEKLETWNEKSCGQYLIATVSTIKIDGKIYYRTHLYWSFESFEPKEDYHFIEEKDYTTRRSASRACEKFAGGAI